MGVRVPLPAPVIFQITIDFVEGYLFQKLLNIEIVGRLLVILLSMICRFTSAGEKSTEIRYYISNLGAGVKHLAAAFGIRPVFRKVGLPRYASTVRITACAEAALQPNRATDIAFAWETPGLESSEHDALTLRRLRQGNFRAALDRAKSVHKTRPSPENTAMLLRCYAFRAKELRSIGRTGEADALDAYVDGCFPPEAVAVSRAVGETSQKPPSVHPAGGEKRGEADPLGDALVRLADAGISEEDASIAEAIIAEHAFDPVALAAHPALTPGHPLADAANAVATAFSTVVARQINDAEISLPAVSRRGPFAGWKLLIRCIAHLQRREDGAAARALDALAPMKCAPARLVPVLRAILAEKWDALDSVTRRIFSAWRPGEKRLPSVLARLDSALAELPPRDEFDIIPEKTANRRRKALFAALRDADAAVCREAPALIGRFREMSMAKALLASGLSLPELEKHLGGQPARTASFWRLAALAMEVRLNAFGGEQSLSAACDAWDAFRRHGVAEGLFPAGGPEEAEVYLHLADMLAGRRLRGGKTAERGKFAFDQEYCYGSGQTEAVRALAPALGDRPLPLDSMELFARAAQLNPSGKVFRAWLEAATRLDGEVSWKRKGDIDRAERVLLEWSGALPNDPAPWLIRMNSAEERDALTLAQKYLAQAGILDPLNADLTRAKWRLALAMCRRHLKQGKAHLVEADIGKLESLRRHGPENADWLLTALRWMVAAVIPNMARRVHGELAAMAGGGIAGECAAGLLEAAVLGASHASLYPKEPPVTLPPAGDPALVVAAAVRAVKLAANAGFIAGWGAKSPWPKWFVGAAASLPGKDLPLLAEFMLPGKHFREAFALTAAGLEASGKTATTGRLLYVRGLAVLRGNTHQSERVRQCLRAAMEISRRENDGRLIAAVSGLVRKEAEASRYPFNSDDFLMPMRDDELDEALRIEQENPAFPAFGDRDPHIGAKYRREQEYDAFFNDDDDDDPEMQCQCPECRRKRGEPPLRFEGTGLPPAMERELAEILESDEAGPQYKAMISSILGDLGFSAKAVDLLGPVILPAMVAALITDKGIGNGLSDFLRKNPALREEVMTMAASLPPGDRRILEEGDRLAAARSASRRKKQAKGGRRKKR